MSLLEELKIRREEVKRELEKYDAAANAKEQELDDIDCAIKALEIEHDEEGSGRGLMLEDEATPIPPAPDGGGEGRRHMGEMPEYGIGSQSTSSQEGLQSFNAPGESEGWRDWPMSQYEIAKGAKLEIIGAFGLARVWTAHEPLPFMPTSYRLLPPINAPRESEPANELPNGTGVEIPEGFVPWSGGECPVPTGAAFEVVTRNGARRCSEDYSWPYFTDNWRHTEPLPNPKANYDIIAYRVIESESEIPEGFVKWEGGECPIIGHPGIEVCRRNGIIASGLTPSNGWQHDGGAMDIIAYRITPPPEPTPPETIAQAEAAMAMKTEEV
jgi:hypothetical protein